MFIQKLIIVYLHTCRLLYLCTYTLRSYFLQEKEEQEKKRKNVQMTTPHLWNLHEDPQLTHVVVHMLQNGNNMLGRDKVCAIGTDDTVIVLSGLRYG